MKNQVNSQISIPKPCHEDWNKMTPNEQGSFCSKCAKTVIDFTKRTNEEILNYMSEQSGKKICGRFMNDQLESDNSVDIFIPLHLIPRKLSFNKAFVFSLFIVFGTTLFSCTTQKGEVVGKISSSRIECSETKGDVAIEEIQGEVVANTDTTAVVKDTIQSENMMIGKLKMKK
jgi:hypothetical protein